MQMVGGNGENQFRQYAGQNVENLNGYNDVQNVGNQVIQNAVQNQRIQNVRNQNGQIAVLGNANQNPNGNGNLVAARAEVRPKRKDATYLQTQLPIAQKEEAGIQLQAEEFDLMAAAANLDEIEEVNANYILMANLQQASASGTQTDKASIFDSDGSAEVHNYENCYDNEIFNMFTQEEQYTELLEPISEPHQLPQNDNNVISDVSSVEQSGGTVEQHPANVEETLVSQDIMSVVQNNYVVDTSNLQTELERTKERFENCIIINENQYAKLWNDWYKKCKECKFDKISYDKAYKDMQQKIERLQAQLRDLKGKSKDTSCVSDTLNPLSHKLENEKVELEFQVLNYAKENAHLKTTYKNLFDSISVSRTQTKKIIAYLQNKLHNTIYENAKLRAHLFNKVSDQKDNTRGTSTNTKFAKQSIVGNLPKVGETHALSKPVTSNSIPTPQESKVMKNDKVITPGMFRINPFKTSREEKHVPNNVKASVSDQKDTACGKSKNTKFAKQSILGRPPKVGETHALSKPVTSNSISTPQGSKVVKNDKVIAPGMFRINPFKPLREEKHVPNKVRESDRTKPITVS
uniref:Integrase, catalytic region, zinc finger, CCHC-type, peptidase aspartic, catalytic n=1 Tax=Tanacetum cinerariifolium TaxID=118510 RepID=A0A699IX21_TANCI|nr:hypothetical protein [Tanacetum cinerariifolium]